MLMSQSNKRKSSGHHPTKPPHKKTRQLTSEQALIDIQGDWHIIKMARNKDQKYKPFLQNKTFILQILDLSRTVLKYLPHFKDDKEVVHDAILLPNTGGIQNNPSAFQYASERIKHNPSFVREIRDYMRNEKGGNRMLLTFEKLIPPSVLRQLEPYSRHWLDKAISEGDFASYQAQVAHDIVPKRREKLISDLARHFLQDSRSTQDRGYFEIFMALIHGEHGQTSLLRVSKGSNCWRLCQFCLKSDNIFYEVTSRLRSETLFINEMTDQLTLSLFKERTNIERDLSRLDQLAFGNTEVRLQILETVFKALDSNASRARRKLDFDDIGRNVSDALQPSVPVQDEIMVRLLVKCTRSQITTGNVDTYRTCLIHCIKLNFVKATRLFLERGLSPNIPAAFSQQHSPSVEAVKAAAALWQLDDGTYRHLDDGTNPTAMLELLHEFGARFDQVGILHEALGNFPLLTYLLQHGADIDKPDSEGYTILHLSVGQNYYQQATSLLALGANPDIPNLYGRSALFKAVNINSVRMVQLLLDNNADMAVRDNQQQSILHCIGYKDWQPELAQMFQALLNAEDRRSRSSEPHHALDLNAKNSGGLRPLTISKTPEFCELLLSEGAGGVINRRLFMRINFDAVHSPVVCSEKQNEMMGENTTECPCRLKCRHVYSGEFLNGWLNTHKEPPYSFQTHTNCPECRRDIGSVEVLSLEAAAHWDEFERRAIATKTKMKAEIDDINASSTHRRMVENLARSRQDLKKLEEEEAAEEARKRAIREASDAEQKGFRDIQLVETFKTTLKF